jgi:hypothetical protein
MFSYDIDTSIDIEAQADAIWQVLTEFSAYEDWSPMLRNVQTQLQPGAPVRFEVLREGSRPMKLKAKITTLSEDRGLAWRGGSAVFVSGEHYFRIEQLAEGLCRLHHGERFKGLIVPLLKPKLKRAPELYRAMNEALKCRVEDRSSPLSGHDNLSETN